MTRDELIEPFAAAAGRHAGIDALLLGGSLGRGEGDAYSDVDLIVVTPPAAHAAFVEAVRAWAADVAEPVLWRQVYPGLPLFHAVTADYLRYDITVTTAERVAESADRVRPLVDKVGIYERLPATRERPPVSAAAVFDTVEEFLRILGLLPVAVGRSDYAALSAGVGLLRQQLQALMVLEQRPVTPPGALALRRALPSADLATLTALAAHPTTTREGGIGASLAVAEVFLRRARPLAAAAGAAWPDALEAAVRGHLARELGIGLSA
jgi:hypothetical protein